MEHLPFPDAVFDLVICSWVLEHLTWPQHAFGEIARVLRDPVPTLGESGGHFVFLAPNAWHPLTWFNRLLGRFGDWQAQLVMRVYDRPAADTFPALYRANTRRKIERLARTVGLSTVTIRSIGDPTYLAFGEWLYRLSVLLESLTPQWMKVHLVGDFVKEKEPDDPS
jgi:SAM-dependent methyltransferase